MGALRWLLVLPALVAGPVIAFVLSFLLLLAANTLCSAEGENVCTALSRSILDHMAIAVACCVGAAIAILFPAVLAPRYKSETAILALVLEAVVFGFVLARFGAMFPAYLVTLVSLVLCVAFVRRRCFNAG